MTGSETDAADLTQQTFTRVWRALGRFAGRSSLNSWLHGIAYHVYQDWRRADHRWEPRPDAWWEECADDRPGPDDLRRTWRPRSMPPWTGSRPPRATPCTFIITRA